MRADSFGVLVQCTDGNENFQLFRSLFARRRLAVSPPRHGPSNGDYYHPFPQIPESDQPSTSMDSDEELPYRDSGNFENRNFQMFRQSSAARRMFISVPRSGLLNDDDNHPFLQIPESDQPSTSMDSDEELPYRDSGNFENRNFQMFRQSSATRGMFISVPRSGLLNDDDNHPFPQIPENNQPSTSMDSDEELPYRDSENFENRNFQMFFIFILFFYFYFLSLYLSS